MTIGQLANVHAIGLH